MTKIIRPAIQATFQIISFFQLLKPNKKITSPKITLPVKNKFKTKRENWKFPPLNENDINERVKRIKHVLKIKQKMNHQII